MSYPHRGVRHGHPCHCTRSVVSLENCCVETVDEEDAIRIAFERDGESDEAVRCFNCDREQWGLATDTLHTIGWRTVRGCWFCPICWPVRGAA